VARPVELADLRTGGAFRASAIPRRGSAGPGTESRGRPVAPAPLRHGQDAIEIKRAQVILARSQGKIPPRTADITLMNEDYTRREIRALKEHGVAMLRPRWAPGRAPKFTHEHRKGPVDLALSRPLELQPPYSQWSLSRLLEQGVARGSVESISGEWPRLILH